MRALVFGALGFTGTHLVRRLHQLGDIRTMGADLRPEAPDDSCLSEYRMADLGRQEQVSRTMEEWKPDWIFNLVGLVRGTAEEVYQTNLMGSIYLLEAVRLHIPDARVLLIGSSAEYGNVTSEDLPITEEQPCRPLGAYGASKHAMTQAGLGYVRQYGTRVVVARPFNIIGAGIPSSLVVGAVLQRVKDALSVSVQPTITAGNLDTERDFVAVEDVVDSYLKMIEGEYWGEVFNICSGQPCPVRAVVDLVLSHAPRQIRVEHDPALVRPDDVSVLYGSYEKAERTFGFVPRVSLRQSISNAWAFAMSDGAR